MARRGAKSSVPPQPRPSQSRTRDQRRHAGRLNSDDQDRGKKRPRLSERVRRIALGLTAALVTARAFWPSEPDLKEGAGAGLYWVFVVFIVVRAGAGRRRWSAAAFASAGRGPTRWSSGSWSWSRRVHPRARSPAGDQPGMGVGRPRLGLPLLRNLPRTRDESSALAGVHGGDGVRRLGLWSVSGRRSSCR